MNLFNLIYGKNVWGLIRSTYNYLNGWILSPWQLLSRWLVTPWQMLRWWIDTNAQYIGITLVIAIYVFYRYEVKQERAN